MEEDKIESITDENYEDFKDSPRAVLLVSTSWCDKCKEYSPIIETLNDQINFIRFGETILDKDRSIQLKKEYPNMGRWILPTTVFFKKGAEAGKTHGIQRYLELISKVQEYLLLGENVFIQGENNAYVSASMQQINKLKEPYLVKLKEDSSLGVEGKCVWIPSEKINWGLEEKL